MEQNQTLEIPENIPLRRELWRGFGWAELAKSSVVVGTAIGGVLIYLSFSTSAMRLLSALMVVCAACMISAGLFTRQNTHLSIYDYLKNTLLFHRSQHRYDDVAIEEVIVLEEA